MKTSTRGFEVRAQRNTDEPGRVEPGAVQMGHERPRDYAALAAETRPYGNGETVAAYKGFTSSVPPDRHTEAWLTDKTLEFLGDGRDEERPFAQKYPGAMPTKTAAGSARISSGSMPGPHVP